jgi:hypothetical protein
MPAWASVGGELCPERLSAATGLVRVRIDELEIAAMRSLIIELCLGESTLPSTTTLMPSKSYLGHWPIFTVKVDRKLNPEQYHPSRRARPAFRDALDVKEALYFDCASESVITSDFVSIISIHRALLFLLGFGFLLIVG